MLEGLIERDKGIMEYTYRTTEYFLKKEQAKEEAKKKKRRKWIRYERKHSLEAIHMDWQEQENGEKTCIIEDDVSRAILGGGEFEHTSKNNSIAVFRNMMDVYEKIGRIKMLIIDNSSEFGAHRKDEKGNWNSEFKGVVESYGIKIVTTCVNHSQTNGKLERFWLEYDRHRWRFDSIDEFISWYNHRIHGSLWLQIGENPSEAFIRKAPPESLLGLFFSISQSNEYGGENHAFK